MELAELVQRFERLEQEHVELKSELQVALEQRNSYHDLYMEALERCKKLERGLLGKASEKLPRNEQQLSLGMLGLMLGEREKADIEALDVPREVDVAGHKRQSGGRNPIPESLPRVDIEIIPDEVQRKGLDAFNRIGEDVTEVIERRPGSIVVARIIKPKFVSQRGTLLKTERRITYDP